MVPGAGNVNDEGNGRERGSGSGKAGGIGLEKGNSQRGFSSKRTVWDNFIGVGFRVMIALAVMMTLAGAAAVPGSAVSRADAMSGVTSVGAIANGKAHAPAPTNNDGSTNHDASPNNDGSTNHDASPNNDWFTNHEMKPEKSEAVLDLAKLTTYRAAVNVDPGTKKVTGHLQIEFVPRDPDVAYLHIYPYAFTEPKRGMLWEGLLGSKPSVGTYRITKLTVQGKPAAYQRKATVVKVPLGKTGVKPGTAIEMSLDFSMTLPRNMGRMSYDDHAIWLGNWLPVLAVHDASGWHLDPYGPVGDPFFSEVARYELELTLPAGYQFASTATDRGQTGRETIPGQRTYTLEVGNVRDFALVIMDHTYQPTESLVGDTWVRSWWRQGDSATQVERNHLAAVRSFAYFQSQFGLYPYSEYDVVRIGGSINGMENPGLVFVDGSHYQGDHLASIPTVVHETAHQWFYGLVGNNQVEEAWLDEGLAEYASLAFMLSAYPQLGKDRVQARLVRGTTTDFYAAKGLSPWMPLSRFPDNDSYSDLVYSRTASMLLLLREAWGEKRLHAMLHRFVTTYQYQVATGKAWVEALSAEAGEDAEPFIQYWLLLDKGKEKEAQEWLDRQRAEK
ncbi:M1 family metallopeptidase [Brevibacillus ruminantium]|uniref:M1 family metallopeptidase n=1 Tax=Brevibacillus ruminantium TaxID=2950604 RepID=A0ABY4WLX2_9BACL|nr:M1 family metallopeptidase [Brevibacillus ruminantium]USG66379.1 M1 family metallopeptidase [Brevibacillus ruminantium]